MKTKNRDLIHEIRKFIFVVMVQISLWFLPEGDFKNETYRYLAKNFEKL
ncbi:hypothetical protein J2810_004588 [Chryseobacterium rhizosphaerae]|nr:hypothetical protein [Chryseobacterium rhizosphaerae]